MIKPEVVDLANKIYKSYEKDLIKASLSEIEEGVKGAVKYASYIYVIRGANNVVFYVGMARSEGGIKHRFIKHSPKHNQKEFYPYITEVQFLEGDFTEAERLFLESAFTIALKPSHMDNRL